MKRQSIKLVDRGLINTEAQKAINNNAKALIAAIGRIEELEKRIEKLERDSDTVAGLVGRCY